MRFDRATGLQPEHVLDLAPPGQVVQQVQPRMDMPPRSPARQREAYPLRLAHQKGPIVAP